MGVDTTIFSRLSLILVIRPFVGRHLRQSVKEDLGLAVDKAPGECHMMPVAVLPVSHMGDRVYACVHQYI